MKIIDNFFYLLGLIPDWLKNVGQAILIFVYVYIIVQVIKVICKKF